MHPLRALLALAVLGVSFATQAPQNPPPPAAGGQRGGGRGRGAVALMALSSPAWPDGGAIPLKHTQRGDELSPALAWTSVPESAVSFVLVLHDLDAVSGTAADDTLHWLLWNIPAAARTLSEHVPQGATLADGTRQIGATGPYYRGPAVPAGAPAHHYVFELFALDAMLDVPAVGASPAQTRAAVLAAMGGHVRGKGVYVGLFTPER
jgi:Raf kinase inhibitor-like YbhB/YbcL family protein